VWVVNTIAAFFALDDKYRLFHKNRLEIGSTPDEGSSKNIIFGLASIAILTHNFLLLPPLKFPAFTLIYGVRDKRS
jgi:hypothetical protein